MGIAGSQHEGLSLKLCLSYSMWVGWTRWLKNWALVVFDRRCLWKFAFEVNEEMLIVLIWAGLPSIGKIRKRNTERKKKKDFKLEHHFAGSEKLSFDLTIKGEKCVHDFFSASVCESNDSFCQQNFFHQMCSQLEIFFEKNLTR